MTEDHDLDVVIVGAGFAGMYMLHKVRGLGLSARCIEAGGDVGGTWYWNRYPGARCDVESMQYSYEFSDELQQEWDWSERYATQPEILSYAQHVADRFDLRDDIQFDTRVESATFDDDDRSVDGPHRPRRRADRAVRRHGDRVPVVDQPARHPRAATRSTGASYHTGRWPHEGVDFTGLRVGVIGTGSSAIQSIPLIARGGGRAPRLPAHALLLGARAQPAARPRGARDASRPTTPRSATSTASPPRPSAAAGRASSDRPSRSPRRSAGPSTRPAGPTAA